ncbi:MAG: hypothetical protein M1839_004950 [Geoglossum umbratile]|nr:MAG: hypothetical protein M1839_004950 [Geoglossum umbratile]
MQSPIRFPCRESDSFDTPGDASSIETNYIHTPVFTEGPDPEANGFGESDSSHTRRDGNSIIEISDTPVLTDSDSEPDGFPEEDFEFVHVVSTAAGHIWGPWFFPGAFIGKEGSNFMRLPVGAADLFRDASKDIVKWYPQEGKVFCCAYFTFASRLHKLAFDTPLGPEKTRLLEKIRPVYLQHVGEWENVDLSNYWEDLLVSLYRMTIIESFLTFQGSVGSVIEELAEVRGLTTKVYRTFVALTNSSQSEFHELATNQLYMFLDACYRDGSYSLGRPLLCHWLTNMGGLVELVVSPISATQELTALVWPNVY